MDLYPTLEDKWYDLIDTIDSKIPIGGIIDKIDTILPSFVLFLSIIALIIIILLLNISFSGPQYTAEITVFGLNNVPLEGAQVNVLTGCGIEELITFTNDEGKTSVRVCATNINITASKNGYYSDEKTGLASDKHILTLNPKISPSERELQIFVTNGKINIEGAEIDFLCDGKKLTYSEQTSEGFKIANFSCIFTQVAARAEGFEEKIQTIGNSDERIVIELKRKNLTGKLIFEAVSNGDSLNNLEVLFTNSAGETFTRKTNLFGYISESLTEGEYSYTTDNNGDFKSGTFIVSAGSTEVVSIIFEAMEISPEEKKYLAVEVFDENNQPIYLAEVTFYRDNTQIGGVQKTNTSGRINPKLINLSTNENNSFSATVSATGHITKIINVQLLDEGKYQTIILEKGSSILKINIVNDNNKAENSAFVQVLKDTIVLAKGYTNDNGKIEIENLPAGIVTIKANDKYKKDFATEITTLQKDSVKEITLMLMTGEGQIKYYFENLTGKKINPLIKVFDLNGQIFSGFARSGYYQTEKIKAGTQINIENNDTNFLPYTDFTYKLDSSKKDKTIVLIDDLPNQNKIQLFLTKVYSSNPLNSNANSNTEVKKIFAGTKYWLHFLLVINDESSDVVTANFTLNNTAGKVFINDTFSTKEFERIMVSEKKGKYIDVINDALVDELAVQSNIIKDVTGRVAVPIILSIETDENFDGNFNLEYYARFGLEESLVYENKFVIGETFCTNNCPIFAFDNFIIKENNRLPVEENTMIYIGDNYSLETIVKNLSDKELGQVVINNIIEKSSLNKLSFQNDSNSVSKNIILSPQTSTSGGIHKLETKKAGRATIIQLITKPSDTSVEDFEGNDTYFKLNVAEKKELAIETSPRSIEEGAFYPIMIISTKYLPYNKISAHWKAKKVVDGIETEILSGTTDENGIEFIQFDVAQYGLKKGDKIIFTTYNDIGSIEGKYELFVNDSFNIIEEPDECLTVELNGISYIENETYTTINTNDTTNLEIKSTCNVEREVYLATDLELSTIRTIVPANGNTNITIKGKPRDNLLGAYPIQVFAKNGNKISQIALVDVVLEDSFWNHFDLETAIFDFRQTNKISSKIINKSFMGRKDNFYPQVNISTNSVSLDYNKPGIPETYKFTAKVVGSMLESLVQGFVWKVGIYQTHRGEDCSNPPVGYLHVPKENESLFLLEELSTNNCEEMIEEVEEWEAYIKPKWAPPEKITPVNPTWNSSEIITEEDLSQEDFNGGELSEKKEKKISFEETNIEVEGNPFDVHDGDVFQLYPVFIGEEEAALRHPGCTLDWDIGRVSADRPDGWWDEDGLFKGAYGVKNSYLRIAKAENCNPCAIPYFGFNEGYYAKIETRGIEEEVFWIGNEDKSAKFDIVLEHSRVMNFMMERQAEWEKEIEIKPIEGEVYKIGAYHAVPVPELTNVDEIKGDTAVGEVFSEMGIYTGLVTCIKPMGFVPPEKGVDSEDPTHIYPIDDPENNPLVEYSLDGMTKYFIPEESIPEDLNVYLLDGQYYAEYVGVPTVPGNNINFTLSTNDLLGKEYVILEVTDWVPGIISFDEGPGLVKEKRAFQIKLIGNEHNCYSTEGVEGFTGKEYSPRLLFDWDWQKISQNQCETTNNGYTYCDATQFTISLFKKLELIENYLNEGNNKELPKQTSFYTYLIKDNYSDKFLSDFSNYYGSTFMGSSQKFVEKFKNFITQNRLSIKIDDESGEMPYGGLYQVSINIENAENINSLFEENNPTGQIEIILRPKSIAKNYNPLYEMPFDGSVGGTEKIDYGTGFNGTLPLNEKITLENITSKNNKNLFTTNSLNELNKEILLKINKDTIYFYPSQPTPITASIESSDGKAEIKYSISSNSSIANKEWQMTASNIGDSECIDFEKNYGRYFDAFETSGTQTIKWDGTKPGKISLSTIFFTPPNSKYFIKAENDTTKLSGPSYLKNNENYFLDNYDSQAKKYITIKDIFNMIQQEEVCMSKNSENELTIFWNRDYLDHLKNSIPKTSGTYACN